ncbi:hypothetical protein [Yokenella regensburgei]|uniref:hypothetical protein n=1 Tax=Yokenella regensburgei TaxID=158877 RepID=UPI0031DDA6C4
MLLNEKMVVISVPESLIPGLAELSGPITLYMDKLHVDDGFAHADGEFVTSLQVLSGAIGLAGISQETLAIMLERD